ncbi:MAG: carboxymuconolactone decarboxylase family protein [Hyphomicrobiaceae bacterium]
MDQDTYRKGLQLRREVLGDRHVDGAVDDDTPFDQPLQEFICGFAWGELWSRPTLSRRDRSLVILAMFSMSPRRIEMRAHIIGALRNGATPEEIREVLLHTAVYFGFPAVIESFRIAKATLAEVEVNPEFLKSGTKST